MALPYSSYTARKKKDKSEEKKPLERCVGEEACEIKKQAAAATTTRFARRKQFKRDERANEEE